MLGHLTWQRIVSEFVILVLIAGGVSLIIGHFLLCIIVALIGLLSWHYYQMRRLSHWLWHEDRLLPPDGKGSWIPIFHGISRMRLKQREERNRLASMIRYFRNAAESVPDAVVLCDKIGRLMWCNREAGEFLGLRWPQDKQQIVLNLLRYPEFHTYFKEGDYRQPFMLQMRNGYHLELRLLYPYIEENLLIIARDITERKQIEGMRQNFFANVNHELRVPLTVIKGYLEMLSTAEEEQTEFMTTALKNMTQQTDRLYHLVQQLMNLSRIETAATKISFEPINVSEIIEQLITDFTLQQPNYQITIEIEPNLYVLGDVDQLQKVVTNLFYNAIEHNGMDAQYTLQWQVASDYNRDNKKQVVFRMKDTGKGISKAHLAHLTERFYRVDSSRNREETGGSGLGLAIVKHALQNHQK